MTAARSKHPRRRLYYGIFISTLLGLALAVGCGGSNSNDVMDTNAGSAGIAGVAGNAAGTSANAGSRPLK